MDTKKDLITSRIKKLLAHAESAKKLGSLHEAEMFAAKANELLTEYNISMFDVNQSIENEEFENWQYSENLSYRDNQASHGWKYRLCQVLCKYNFCSFTFQSRLKTLRVFGKMENVDSVVWLYNFLSVAIFRLALDEYNAIKSTLSPLYTRFNWLKDFCVGAVVGLETKFKQERAKYNDIQSLVIYNNEALNKFVNKTSPNLKTRSGVRKTVVGEAYTKGKEVGVNLNTNVKLKESKQPIIKRLN